MEDIGLDKYQFIPMQADDRDKQCQLPFICGENELFMRGSKKETIGTKQCKLLPCKETPLQPFILSSTLVLWHDSRLESSYCIGIGRNILYSRFGSGIWTDSLRVAGTSAPSNCRRSIGPPSAGTRGSSSNSKELPLQCILKRWGMRNLPTG